jgi:hypothetical protein
MSTGERASGAKRRVVSLLGVCMLCVFSQLGTSRATGQVERPGDPAPVGRTGLLVTTEPGDSGSPPVYRLALTGDLRIAGPTGAFYRTTRPISHTQVIEVDPPAERLIPEGSNPLTQLVLWNERAEDGKLRPHRAIRHAGSHAEDLGDGAAPLGNWSDENDDGIDDLGFVCIGMTDYRVMLRYAEFDPVGVSRADGGEFDAASEPYQVGESAIVQGLRASNVPDGCHLYIVQFWTQPLPEFLDGLQRVGGAILSFLPEQSYIVSLPSDEAVASVSLLETVRWVGSYHPAYRLDERLLAQYFTLAGLRQNLPTLAHFNVQVFERGPAQQEALDRFLWKLGTRLWHINQTSSVAQASRHAHQHSLQIRMGSSGPAS